VLESSWDRLGRSEKRENKGWNSPKSRFSNPTSSRGIASTTAMILSEDSQLFRRSVKQANVYHPQQRRGDNRLWMLETFGALAFVYTPYTGCHFCCDRHFVDNPFLFFFLPILYYYKNQKLSGRFYEENSTELRIRERQKEERKN